MAGKRIDWVGRSAELKAVIASGKSMAEVAAHFGCKTYSVAAAMHRQGLRISAEACHRQRVASFRAHYTEERRERARERMKRLNETPEFKAKVLESRQRYWSKWRRQFPAYLWPEYQFLAFENEVRAAEAKAIIRDQFARDLRRTLRQIAAVAAEQHKRQREEAARSRTDFDAILARVAAGKSKVQVLHRPASRDHEFSLTGSTLA